MPFSVSTGIRAAILIGFALLLVTPKSQAAPAPLDAIASSVSTVEFTLQVGAFQDSAAADRVAAGIGGAWIQVIVLNNVAIYRVNYGRFQDRSQAIQAQWDLEDLGFEPAIQQLFA
jgi:cell division protein FtsN